MEDPERRPKNTNYGVCAFWCLMMLLIVIVGLVFAIVYLTVISENVEDDEIPTTSAAPVTGECNTPECVTLASSLIQTMESSLNPCQDFYDYACGNWIKNTRIPEGYGKINTWHSQKDRDRELKVLLEASEKPDEPEAIKKAKAIYNSCMDKGKREQHGITEINTGVETVFGGWPVLENNLGGKFDASSFNMTALLTGLFVDAGSTSLIRATAMYDSEFQLVISAGTMTGLPSEEYLVDTKYNKERNAYVKYMTDVAILLGAHPDVATPEMLAVLDLEKQLAQAKLESNPTPGEMVTVAEMQERYPEINWHYFLKTLVPESVAEITDEFVVVDKDSEYLRKALDILNGIPPRLIADWMLWLCYDDATLYLNDAIRNAYYEFVTSVHGTPPREYYQDCVDVTTNHLHSATSRLYADKYFSMETKSSVEEIAESVKKAQDNLIDDSDSFDEETKEMVVAMLKNITVKIGLPHYIFNNSHLDQEYENLDTPGDDIFKNFLSVLSFRVKQNIALLSEDGFENMYLNRPKLMEHKPVVLPEDAQPPVFNSGWPWSINLGNLGMIIARDLTKAIDPAGTLKAETRQCLEDEYSKFHLPENGKPVPGNEIDIIADNAALEIATKAFMDEMKRRDTHTLPGLALSVQQLFFLNNAQLWCEKYTPEYADTLDTRGETPGRFRVNGMLRNSASFSEAFDCPVGTDMNPEEKCIVL